MDSRTKKSFRIVFQEAHVVDADFSKWDQRIRLLVVAGLFGKNFSGRGPLHAIDFEDLQSLKWHSHHLGVKLNSKGQHCQWVIMESKIRRQRLFYVVNLSGFGPTPEMEIRCRDIKISEIDPAILDVVNPNWNKPYAPLARPGVEELRFAVRSHSRGK